MTESLTLFIFQLSIIIIAAWLGGRLFEKFNFPSVLGEILAGMLIGPHFLGGISFPGFSGGLFPASSGGVPVSAELYGIALLASIILLFFVGMETDVGAFLRFSFKAITVGLGGAVLSFFAGNFTGIFLFSLILGPEVSFLHPGPLFLGVISMTTSIGISARILSEKRKMDSPEGVTIISAAVIDDVLGIIALTVVIGIVQSSDILWKDITFIAGRSILIWLGFTAAGIIFYRQLARFLKMFGDRISIAIISLALSFLLAGVFEKSGMAMIVGAYVMGLALSQTDLSGIIQDNLEGLRRFFVPIFFCVMGMMVNFSEISSFAMIAFGLIFTLSSILSKVIGCGVPAYFMNFSLSGSASVGVGMVPREEVAFTIAGIGLASGVLPREAFSIAVMMTFITAIVTPPVFSAIISSDKPALKKKAPPKIKHREIRVPVPNRETG
ncbi:MAG: cation:proton antiporter, partial [Elusimicrobiota bacterium]